MFPKSSVGVWEVGKGGTEGTGGWSVTVPAGKGPWVGVSPEGSVSAPPAWLRWHRQARRVITTSRLIFFLLASNIHSLVSTCVLLIDAREPLMLIYGGEVQPIYNCTLEKGDIKELKAFLQSQVI